MEQCFVLDQHTGEILGRTPVMDTQHYKNRFVPWEGPIPAGGRVDLLTWHSRKVSEQVTLGAELVAFAAEQAKPKVLPEAPQPPPAPKLSAEQRLETIKRAMSKFIKADDATLPERMSMINELNGLVQEEQRQLVAEALVEDRKAPEGAASPAPMTDEQRLEKIAEAISKLNANDFTEAGEPRMDVLSALCGFDVAKWQRQKAEALGSIGNS